MQKQILALNKIISQKKFVTILGFLGLYLLASGSSWLVFSYLSKPSGGVAVITGDLDKARSKIDTSGPKTEECPINGMKYTKIERGIWEGRRPITAMIENHADSRPPSGLSRADVIYEAVAEGGITRFLAVMYCGLSAGDVEIAPVRSARIYFVDWAQEWGDKPLFVHVGGANNYSGSGDTAREVRALETLEAMGWRIPKGNDFDTTYDSGFPVFWRNYERLDHEVATEHTMVVSTDAAYKEAEKRNLGALDKSGKAWNTNYITWKFADEKAPATPKADKISFEFWSNKPDYNVEWNYDKVNNIYLRTNGGKPHTDLEYDSAQLSTKNLVIQFVVEKGSVDRNLHMSYANIGQGKALVFQNGDAVEATWKKASKGARTVFYAKDGSEILFVRGTIWIEALPVGNTVQY